MHRLDAQLMRQGVCLGSPEGAAIVTQEFGGNRPLVRACETRFHGLIIMSPTGSPGKSRPIQARQPMISRAQQSFMKTPVTTSPLSQAISKPPEHQR